MLLLAWRNLRRNRIRTLTTGSAIALSLGLMLISLGMGDAMYGEMTRSAARTAGGDVLVHARGYWASGDPTHLIAQPQGALEAIRRVPGVVAAIPRVRVEGLVSSSRGNAGIQLIGSDTSDEVALQNIATFIAEGEFLTGTYKNPIVLGRGVADDLGLKLGDRVVVTASDPAGDLTRALFRLEGVTETGSEMADGAAAYTTLEAAKRAIDLGSAVHQIGVVLAPGVKPKGAKGRIAEAAGSAVGEPLEILCWREAMPELVSFIEMDARFNYVFSAVLFVVVGFGIANTFLMIVLERIRELGLLSALGLTPARIARLIFSETVILAIVAIAIGQLLGLAGHWWLSTHGIDLTSLSSADFEVSGIVLESAVLRSRIVPIRWVTGTAAVLAVVLLSSVYPAWRATRVDPVEAMRTYE